MSDTPLLEVEHLEVLFGVRRGLLGRAVEHVHAVDDVTVALSEGACATTGNSSFVVIA